MKIVGFQGLRGGVGTTSVVAMIADALHTAGQSVLMVDLNSTDLLRLHFNVPFMEPTGWACAQHLGQPWYEHCLEITPGMSLIPFGRIGLYQRTQTDTHQLALKNPVVLDWLTELKNLQNPPAWVLLDLPHNVLTEGLPPDLLHLHVVVTCVDTACHILLSQQHFHPGTKLLANMQDPTRALHNDLIVEWQMRFQNVLMPLIINRDESLHEALALKTPVTRAFPNSRVAMDAKSLAAWLQIHSRDLP